jgi:hypothetical protein
MSAVIVIGLLDSGLSGRLAERDGRSRRFWLGDDGEVEEGAAQPDPMGHGTALAEVILAGARHIHLLNAQVFDGRGRATPAAAAAGLGWLVRHGARLVNMSFGVPEDREILSTACAEALRAGAMLVAPVPAMGSFTFPAAYPGVLRVTGDARCRADELVWLDGPRAQVGANPWLTDEPPAVRPTQPVAGSSVATARVTARLARLLAERPGATNRDLLAGLADTAEHLGPQRAHLHAG